MEQSKIEFLKKCETEFFNSFQFLINDFASEIEIKLTDEDINLSCIEIYFTNDNKTRAIQVIISEGKNIDLKQTYSISFTIQKINFDKYVESSFSIKEYCNEIKLDVDLKHFFVEIPNFTVVLKEYFEIISSVLRTDKIKSILFSDIWIDITKDFSPYK